jgi:hypothetical protein
MNTPMLRSNDELEKYAILATDGPVGSLRDFYFDDQSWVVRYLIVGTGAWLSGRSVLISPFSVGIPDDVARVVPVTITRQQVRDSPSIDLEKPVSRQHEVEYLGYYGYPYYWGGSGLWGESAYPGMMITGVAYGGSDTEYLGVRASNERALRSHDVDAAAHDDPHLRSCEELAKYHVHASDGDIGHVQRFLIDAQSWAIRYVVVNTSNWWLGHEVLISPDLIGDVSWGQGKVTVKLTRQALRDAPAYDPEPPTGYWAGLPRKAA